MSKENQSNLPAVVQTAINSQKINLSNVNLFLPTQTFGQVIGEYDKVVIEVVEINPDPKEGDVYEITTGKFALSKRPLEMMASALGIVWDPVTTGIVESTPRKSRAKATGAMRKPNGEWIPTTEEKSVDLDAIEEEQRIKQEDYADKGKLIGWNGNKPIHESWDKHGGEPAKLAHIEREVRKALLPYRKFKDERANTGAKERVIKFFLALKSTYTKEELSKSIAFPRIVTDTTKLLADPATRQVAIDKMTGAVRSIFGPGTKSEEPKQIEVPEGSTQYEVTENSEEPEEEIPFDTPPEPEADPKQEEIEEGIKYLRALAVIPYLHKEARILALGEINNAEHDLDKIDEIIGRVEGWLNLPDVIKKHGKFNKAKLMQGVTS